jgi:hypothetical protein
MAARKLVFEKGSRELKELKQWIAALRSGDFAQTDGTLENEGGYCCLGVACKVLIPEDDIKPEVLCGMRLFDDSEVKNNTGFMHGEDPKQQPKSPLWLKKISPDFQRRTGVSLMDMNDKVWCDIDIVAGSEDENGDFEAGAFQRSADIINSEGFDFSEIADHLEMVYVERVLDDVR